MIDIVDDDEAVRMATSLLLRSFGWRARTFASAEEYLAAPSAGEPASCLILDLNMPGMNGAELLELLSRRKPRVPVIVITGRRDPALIARVRDAGAVAILDKPFRCEQLKAAVDQATGRAEPAQ